MSLPIIAASTIAFWNSDAISHSSILLTRLNHFDLTAYGLQISLPTLNPMRCHIEPKAKYEIRSVAFFRQHFQLLAEVHFRGAPE
jgi:hypothetical protein